MILHGAPGHFPTLLAITLRMWGCTLVTSASSPSSPRSSVRLLACSVKAPDPCHKGRKHRTCGLWKTGAGDLLRTFSHYVIRLCFKLLFNQLKFVSVVFVPARNKGLLNANFLAELQRGPGAVLHEAQACGVRLAVHNSMLLQLGRLLEITLPCRESTLEIRIFIVFCIQRCFCCCEGSLNLRRAEELQVLRKLPFGIQQFTAGLPGQPPPYNMSLWLCSDGCFYVLRLKVAENPSEVRHAGASPSSYPAWWLFEVSWFFKFSNISYHVFFWKH